MNQSNYKFDDNGLISREDLSNEFAKRQLKLSGLGIDASDEDHKFTSREIAISRFYVSGADIEEIAHRYNVTRERIRQILAKVQRKLGIKQPPSEPVYGSLTLEEWKDHKQMDELETDIKTHLKVYGLSEDDVESVTRLVFISLRNYFQDKSFMYEGEET